MKKLKKYYKNKFKAHGATLKGVGWSEKKKSKKRYDVLLKILKFKTNKKKISILDAGCGYGELLNHFPKKLKFKYTGIDIVEEMIDYAKRNKSNQSCNFYLMDILKISKKYDFIICNGIFTLKNDLNEKKMQNFVIKCINKFIKYSNIGFSFNMMSDVVDYKSKILFYPKNYKILEFLNNKNISEVEVDKKSVKYEKFYFIKK